MMPHEPVRLGLIANLNARGNRCGRFDAELFRAVLGPHGRLRTSRCLAETADAVGELHEWGADVLAVSGGDGTMGSVVTAAVHAWQGALPQFLPLPGGTANNLARWLGHRASQASVLRRVIAGLPRGAAPLAVQPVRTLCVSDPRRPAPVYGFVFGNGLVYEYDRDICERGGPTLRNVVCSLLWLSLRGLLGRSAVESVWRTRTAVVELDGATRRIQQFKTLVACAAIALPAGLRPFPLHAPLRAGTFTFLLNAMAGRRLFANLIGILRGRCPSPEHRTGHGSRLSVRVDGGYMLDGELWPQSATDAVTLSSGPVIRLWSMGRMAHWRRSAAPF